MLVQNVRTRRNHRRYFLCLEYYSFLGFITLALCNYCLELSILLNKINKVNLILISKHFTSRIVVYT